MIKNLVKQHIVRNAWQYTVISLVFLVGVMLGEINAANLAGGTRNHLIQIIDGFLKGGVTASREGEGYRLFLTAFFNQTRAVGLIWFLGLTVIGVPFILAIIFFKGFSLGFTVGFLVREKAWLGGLISLASVFPQNLLYVPLTVAWAVIGINFSVYLVRGRFSRGLALGQGLVTYTGAMLLFLLILLLGAFIEAFLSPWLLSLVVK
ncbi:stage II sporulation protein M [Syntrophothermus lipocalidus]|uniref:Stage II sporulation protein M n=1 Tax=Syntrophothermus lipocalidus (strain DSM 12680 / TGB-C1) TaxID=643648 RepID=D7CKP0_SYNLT|nr:stage II sporulation protein M [Syntrophothermus lipocalidus]ADI01275.1 stage II sporulation protein M [Syntrophothermus lipocalidus DSM 12680]